MNEVAQWMALVLIGILLMGVFRQVALMLPPSARAVIGGPRLGARLPRRVVDEVRRVASMDGGREAVVAFVTDNCLACQELLASLPSVKADGRDGLAPIVLVSKSPNEGFRTALVETGWPTIYDEEGHIWKTLGVTATPLVMRIDASGRVNAKEVTPHVDLLARLG